MYGKQHLRVGINTKGTSCEFLFASFPPKTLRGIVYVRFTITQRYIYIYVLICISYTTYRLSFQHCLYVRLVPRHHHEKRSLGRRNQAKITPLLSLLSQVSTLNVSSFFFCYYFLSSSSYTRYATTTISIS
jgi:hypothetical protein